MLRQGAEPCGQNAGKTWADEKCGPSSGPVCETSTDLVKAFLLELIAAGFSKSEIQKINNAMIRVGARLTD